MDPLVVLFDAWSRVVWVFSTWFPSWWESMQRDIEYLRNIGD